MYSSLWGRPVLATIPLRHPSPPSGTWVGAGLVAYGLLGTFTGWGIGTLWTALVGWFLMSAARQERDHAVARSGLEGLRAGQVMTPAPAALPGVS